MTVDECSLRMIGTSPHAASGTDFTRGPATVSEAFGASGISVLDTALGLPESFCCSE